MKKKLILIGAGGHCKSCIEVIESSGSYSIEGLLDDESAIGKEISGYRIIGTDSIIDSLVQEDFYFLITVGQLSSVETRKKLYARLNRLNARMATVVASTAIVSQHADIGAGTVVMHHAFINAGVKIGSDCIINTSAVVEHDAVIGNHCHVSTNSTINGECVIGDEVFIGSGAVLSNNITVASGSVIGAGTVIHRSVAESGTYAGNPFKKIK